MVKYIILDTVLNVTDHYLHIYFSTWWKYWWIQICDIYHGKKIIKNINIYQTKIKKQNKTEKNIIWDDSEPP